MIKIVICVAEAVKLIFLSWIQKFAAEAKQISCETKKDY